MMPEIDFPLSSNLTEEEVIMRTNAEVISHLSLALENVETGEDSRRLLDQVFTHAELIAKYSEKLIQSQRIDIRSVK
tara:strand:- start:159 stop:389 length:231 start_codon:yes stop_codon:yes gene_type:complete